MNTTVYNVNTRNFLQQFVTNKKGMEQMGTEQNNMELSRIDYLILSSLASSGAINYVLGLTIKEMNITEVKRPCIWKHLSILIDKHLVCQSGNYGKQKMYYITEDGINLIKGV